LPEKITGFYRSILSFYLTVLLVSTTGEGAVGISSMFATWPSSRGDNERLPRPTFVIS